MTAARQALSAAEQAKFFADLIARGEVVESDEHRSGAAPGRAESEPKPEEPEKPLPAGVTHEIARDEKDHQPVVRRRRYSAF